MPMINRIMDMSIGFDVYGLRRRQAKKMSMTSSVKDMP